MCLPCKLLSRLCNGSPTFATVCCCFPLALFVFLASSTLGAWGAWNIYSAVQAPEWPDQSTVIKVILGSIQVLSGLCGIVAVVFRWAAGTAMFKVGYKIAVTCVVVYLMHQIIMYIQKAVNKERLSNEEIRDMVIIIALTILYVGATYWIISAMVSLQRVLSVGGHGWECLNYKDVAKRKALQEQQRKARQAARSKAAPEGRPAGPVRSEPTEGP